MHPFLPIFALASAGTVHAWDSTIHSTVAPTAPPTVTEQPWRCVTENATQYFKVPLPTGALLSAIDSYIDAQMEPCLKTIDPAKARYGCYPAKEAWCGFTTAAPTAVLPAWTSLGSAASSFWAAKSSAAISLARQCPLRWYDASLGVIGGAAYLNQTIILGACYEEALSSRGGNGGGVRTTSTIATATGKSTTLTSRP